MSTKISKYLSVDVVEKRGRSRGVFEMTFTDKDGKAVFDIAEDELGYVYECSCYVSIKSAKKLIKELEEFVENA